MNKSAPVATPSVFKSSRTPVEQVVTVLPLSAVVIPLLPVMVTVSPSLTTVEPDAPAIVHSGHSTTATATYGYTYFAVAIIGKSRTTCKYNMVHTEYICC